MSLFFVLVIAGTWLNPELTGPGRGLLFSSGSFFEERLQWSQGSLQETFPS
jgi:hypothetical protein